MNQLVAKLQHFGLGGQEATVYLYLHTHPHQTVWKMAKDLKLPRTTIYDSLYKLEDRGLVEKTVKYKSQEFSAAPISLLETIIDTKKSELDSLSQDLHYIKSQLPQFASPSLNTQVRYYHGPAGIRQMVWNMLKADREMIGYSVYGRVEIVGPKFMARWSQSFHTQGLIDRVIVNPTQRTLELIDQDVKPETHQQSLLDIRVLPQDKILISGDTTIYNQSLALIWWREGEVVGVEIDNPELVKTQLSIFETLWKMAEPVTKYLHTKTPVNPSETVVK